MRWPGPMSLKTLEKGVRIDASDGAGSESTYPWIPMAGACWSLGGSCDVNEALKYMLDGW
jgi:hypothetical protein